MWTNLTGEESLETEEVGCGLDGAENIGQEGERGDVGLGDVALMDTYTQNDLRICSIRYKKNNINIVLDNLWSFFLFAQT